jgi:hypothetical protein
MSRLGAGRLAADAQSTTSNEDMAPGREPRSNVSVASVRPSILTLATTTGHRPAFVVLKCIETVEPVTTCIGSTM